MATKPLFDKIGALPPDKRASVEDFVDSIAWSHASLGGFTPIAVYYGIRGHLARPVTPPRARAGEPEPEVPLEFVFLDPEHRAFPVGIPKAARVRRPPPRAGVVEGCGQVAGKPAPGAPLVSVVDKETAAGNAICPAPGASRVPLHPYRLNT